MKIRKTRIKKSTKANGSVKYTAEYKWGFWWYQFDDVWCDMSVRTIWEQRHLKLVREDRDGIHCLSEQKNLIDFYIERVKYQNACELENKVVRVEYEDYP